MKVEVEIIRRPGIADPEGATVHKALRGLGFDAVESVRFGRRIDVDVATDDPVEAERIVAEMCERLLANPVIEDYTVAARPG